MINPDGVICGFYRPSLSGDDMNRVWQNPDPLIHPEVGATLDLISILTKDAPFPFFLDFHGHTAACNSFIYGFMNEENPLIYNTEKVFPLLMTKYTNLFTNEMCSFLKQEEYEGTMRVVIRRRFLPIFAYTLEMSYGGCDFGPRKNTQFIPNDYQIIGESVAKAISDLLLNPNSIASKEILKFMPFPKENNKINELNIPIFTSIINNNSNNNFFNFNYSQISNNPQKNINLIFNKI